jgi:hypothetical protein
MANQLIIMSESKYTVYEFPLILSKTGMMFILERITQIKSLVSLPHSCITNL